jgi:hypothetical protein
MQLSYTTTLILGFSGFIAAIIGAIKFSQIQNVYRPFIYIIWIGCIADILSIYFAYTYRNNLAVGAIYRLCESLFLLWFFNRLNVFKGHNKVMYLLISIFITIWMADNFLSSHINLRITYYFDMVYALSIVLLSISAINDLLFTEKELLKNPTFLICTGLIIYFTYKVIERLFGLFGLKNSMDFRLSVQTILMIVNCLTNLIYALAVVWMRKRQPFKFQF